MRGVFDGFWRGWNQGAIEFGHKAGIRPRGSADDVGKVGDKSDGMPSEEYEKDLLILELSSQIEALQAEIGNLMASKVTGSGDVETLADVFRLPGFKKLLLDRYHEDSNPKATAAEKKALTNAMQKINAAYEVVESLP